MEKYGTIEAVLVITILFEALCEGKYKKPREIPIEAFFKEYLRVFKGILKGVFKAFLKMFMAFLRDFKCLLKGFPILFKAFVRDSLYPFVRPFFKGFLILF